MVSEVYDPAKGLKYIPTRKASTQTINAQDRTSPM